MEGSMNKQQILTLILAVRNDETHLANGDGREEDFDAIVRAIESLSFSTQDAQEIAERSRAN
jgi:hypothetical protein